MSQPTITELPAERRWFRFNLKHLLLFVVGTCVILASFSGRVRNYIKADKARKTFQGLGGSVLVRVNAEDNHEEAEDGFLFDARTKVSLSHTRVKDEDLKRLSGLPKLSTLWLSDTEIGDQGLAYVGECTTLGTLYLSETRVTDSGMRNLRNLVFLRELWLNDTAITDEGIRHLANLSRLTDLHLSGTHITDVGLAHLEGHPRLEYLEVMGTGVSAEGVAKLRSTLQPCTIRWETQGFRDVHPDISKPQP